MSEQLVKFAYCKTHPNCKLKGEHCLNCEYGNMVTVSFVEVLKILNKTNKQPNSKEKVKKPKPLPIKWNEFGDAWSNMC